jgi:hypothetical protein
MFLWVTVFGVTALLLALVLAVGASSMKHTINLAGVVSVSETVTYTGSAVVAATPTIPAAQSATLTTRTSNTAGSLTMTNSSHGIVTGQVVDLYWSNGQCYGAVVGTVAGTTVPIASVAGGAVLPAAASAITVGIQVTTPFSVVGDNLQSLAVFAPQPGYAVFNDGSTDCYAAYLGTAGQIDAWKPEDVRANPLATKTITKVRMSHKQTTGVVSNMSAQALVA